MDTYLNANRELWDELTSIHERSEFYDIRGFKAGRSTLKSIEINEVGDVRGKSLLHLQCHFSMDTLSWARLGAKTTGVDYSTRAIDLACSLSRETGIKADFILSDIYELPQKLAGQFDIVFTSYGILYWLADLKRWAEIIAHYLKPGGFFYIVEGHPFLCVFDNSEKADDFRVTCSYFHRPEPTRWEPEGDYTDRNAAVIHPSYEWVYSLGDVVNAIIGAGLMIEYLHEFPLSAYRWSPFTERSEDGWWRVKGDKVPLVFSLKAAKQA
ncbi:MAG: methyltransferase domain-containing protein [Dehalococcoidales bacterium]|nr:methyltransferase domain-containing protein [Dehalococcoidales bacterium]